MKRWRKLGLISGNSFFVFRTQSFECILLKFQSAYCLNKIFKNE